MPEAEFPCPFEDDEVRHEWLTCLKYLRDDEMKTMTYRDWIQVAKDSAFDVLVEELAQNNLEHLKTYIVWVSQLQSELMFLNRNGL